MENCEFEGNTSGKNGGAICTSRVIIVHNV